MSISLKITNSLLNTIKQDLSRPHDFAYERVGFIACRVGKTVDDGWILLGSQYYPVNDDHYIQDDSVGAQIGTDAIRKMLEVAYNEPVSIIHVHEHPHRGTPRLSRVDDREMAKLIPNFWHVRPNFPHAALVLSQDSMCGFAWEPSLKERVPIHSFTVVGQPMKFIK